MPYFQKAFWKNVNKEPSDKFMGLHGHDLPLAAVLVVAPLEGDHAVLHGEDTVVGYGDTMGIAAKILHYAGGVFEWRLAVDDPLLAVKRINQVPKSRLI